jgi:hypothetical protein
MREGGEKESLSSKMIFILIMYENPALCCLSNVVWTRSFCFESRMNNNNQYYILFCASNIPRSCYIIFFTSQFIVIL